MNLYKIIANIEHEKWYTIIEAITLKIAHDKALSALSVQLNIDDTDAIDLEVTELGQDQWMRLNDQPELFNTSTFTHTVYCFTDKALTAHLTSQSAAAAYANKLLRQKHQCKIYPYSEQRSHIDYVAERGPDG